MPGYIGKFQGISTKRGRTTEPCPGQWKRFICNVGIPLQNDHLKVHETAVAGGTWNVTVLFAV